MSNINYLEAHSWNPCPACGRPVPPNEWASYMRCEDCWAACAYNPPHASSHVQNGADLRTRGGRPSKKGSK
jgi:hypothetical protein